MKKLAYLVIGILIILGLGRLLTAKLQQTNTVSKTQGIPVTTIPTIKTTPLHSVPLTNISRSIFVPYWASAVNEEAKTYDMYYYFGIRPTKEGEIDNDSGLQNVILVKSIPEIQKKVVLRMLDTTVTEVILQDKTAQKKLFSEIDKILSTYSFSGIIIDLEMPYTIKAEKSEQITKFVQQLCTAIKSDYKTCEMLVYGDFLYRNRPYNLKALGETVDRILIMTYDFHKAGGEPGPNFPFDRRSLKNEGGFDYGYDFKQMVSDVISLVSKEKIEVVFGMYGYDWTMNEQGTPLRSAAALSLNGIELKAKSLKLKKGPA